MNPRACEDTSSRFKVFQMPRKYPQLDAYGDVLKASEAAKIIGVSPRTIIREIQRGNLDGFQMGKSYFITKNALIRHMEGGIYATN